MKVAILGGSSAIARALTERIGRDGGQVALLGRDESRLPSAGGVVLRAACTPTDFDAVESRIVEAAEAMDGLDGIVNCSGSMLLKPAHMVSKEAYWETIAANLTTAFAVVRAGGKLLAKSGGSVVLISSAAVSLGMPNHEAIAAAKGGVEALARSAAATYAARGIRFNAVAPGLTETPMARGITESKATRAVSESLHPLGRLGQPENVASAIYWLLQPEQSWVTGQTIGVDGGLSRVQPRPRMAAAKA